MRKFLSFVKKYFLFIINFIKVTLFTTDKMRWKNVERETYKWDERNRIIASHIPQWASVLDVGAGAQTLHKYLPDNHYIPCDIVEHPGSLYCDLNNNIYPDVIEKYDYVVCSGVIEYLVKPEKVIPKLFEFGDILILTYAPLQDNIHKRMASGWKNHLTESQLEQIFEASQLKWKILGQWRNQIVFCVYR